MARQITHEEGPSAETAGPLPDRLEPLGSPREGAFCHLWKVRQVSSGRILALKRLRPEWQDDRQAVGCLENEARVAGSVESAHVVRFEGTVGVALQSRGASPRSCSWENDAERCRSFGVLVEWIDGETLETVLQHRGRMTVGEALWVVRQCAQGLADLASAGFSHGDVKPANLMVDRAGVLKLIDLGFARRLESGDCRPPAQLRRMTGTPDYMAPELLSREAASPLLGDVYSLGVTLYRMLSGRLPFQGESADSVLRQHRSVRPLRLDRLCPNVPPSLVEVVERMLAKQPLRRPHSYPALLRELLALELTALSGRFCA